MAKTPVGKRYTELYYEHASEVAGLLLRHPSLVLDSAQMLARLAPKIQAAVDGRPTSLSRDDASAAEDLMDLAAAKASPKLQAAIEQVRRDLRGGKLTALFTGPSPPTEHVSIATP